MNGKEFLTHARKISHQKTIEKLNAEFTKVKIIKYIIFTYFFRLMKD